jgi:hypothetical protein
MTTFEPPTKPCHYCGQPVKVGSYRCPHCDRSLAAVEQQEWEQSDPSSESSEESYDRQEPGSGIRLSPVAVAVFLAVISGAVIYVLFLRQPNKDGDLPAIFNTPIRKPVASVAQKNEQEKTSFIRIHEDSDSALKDISASAGKPGESNIQTEKRIRLEKIQLTSAHILEEVRKEENLKAYTVRLTSGREIKCETVSEADNQVTIKLGGLTATFERESIESIEHQSADAANKEMEQMALARATQIVDQGLVRHGNDWITPAEKARRLQQSRARERAAATTVRETTVATPVETKQDFATRRPQTDQEKLKALLSLVREKQVVDADFFGGRLHIEDRGGQWPGGDDKDSSIIAFEAQAEQIDVAQLCEFLKLDFAAAGICEAEMDGGVDTRDPKTLTGEAHVTCREMTIPPIDLSPILSPSNENAALSLSLLAENGIITIEGFQVVGNAYNVVGNGTVRIADEPKQSPINGKFKIILKEAPTLADAGKAGKSMQYVLDALAGSGTEIDVTLSGPISDPKADMVADSAIGSIAFQMGE